MNDDPFVNSKKAFYVDGSFRDIYVFETDESVFGDVPFDAFTPLHRPLQDRTYSLVGSYSCILQALDEDSAIILQYR
jgi:hypothetical protein